MSYQLTKRQAAIMNMLAFGYTTDEIAEELGFTRGVIYHEIYITKGLMEAKTTAHAVALWMTPNMAKEVSGRA